MTAAARLMCREFDFVNLSVRWKVANPQAAVVVFPRAESQGG
jgi:hypothetical protein